MRILFVNPTTSLYTRSISVPLGLLSIASYLESKGHIVKIYDRAVEKNNLRKVIKEFQPQFSGISVLSYKLISDMLHVAKELKRNGIPVVVGGPLPSVLAELTVKYDFIDAVSVGEGEETWLEIAKLYDEGISDLSAVRGLVIKDNNGKSLFTGDREFLDLAVLPPIKWDLVDVPKYFQSSYGCKRMIYLYSAKGCPFSCIFCYNKDFHRCVYRKKPLDVLLEEILCLVTVYGLDGIYFADEMWCRNRAEMKEICTALKNLKLNFVWGCQTRIGLFGEEDFRFMYECGCRWIFFGIESGSEKILERINKKICYDKIEDSFRFCKKAGIACIGSFIAGFPDETIDDLKETVALAKKIETKLINFNYLALVPGSEIYKQLVKNKKYKEAETLEEFSEMNPLEKLEYNYSSIPDIDIKVIRAYFLWNSFFADDVPGTEKLGFAKKVVADAVKSIKTGELISFIVSTYFAGMEFLKITFYANCFPNIRKNIIFNKSIFVRPFMELP